MSVTVLRRIVCVLAAAAALLPAACGKPDATLASRSGASTTPSNGTPPSLGEVVTPATTQGAGTPSRRAGQPAPTGTPRRTGAAGPVVRVMFSHPLPLVEPNPPPYTGIFQDTCGWPNRAGITITIADHERRPYPEFDYEVQTPVPFRGTVTGLTIHNGGAMWSHLLGPFPLNAANKAGGTIAVTVRVKYADGSTRTATASTVLKPCNK
jgi:hypothetical protein